MTSILNFRRIKDDSLTPTDRIIFSLLWKWHWANLERIKKAKPARRISVRRLMRWTNHDNRTIAASINHLQSLGYLLGLVPVTDHPNLCGYYKLRLTHFTNKRKTENRWFDTVAKEVFNALVSHEFNQFAEVGDEFKIFHTANWWRKVLGISRRNYFRWANSFREDDGEAAETKWDLMVKDGFDLYW